MFTTIDMTLQTLLTSANQLTAGLPGTALLALASVVWVGIMLRRRTTKR
ncbi:MAG: hypothetical protein ACPGKS_08070 [Coraliomargarita sp.]